MGIFGRHLRLLFLGTALVVAAFSTGIDFLFFLVYLLGGHRLGSWLYARRGLRGVRADYRVLNPRDAGRRGAAGDLPGRERTTRWGKPWIELLERLDPAGQPARPRDRRPVARHAPVAGQGDADAAGRAIGSARSASGPATRSASSPARWWSAQPTSVVVFPEVVPLPHWRLPPSPIDGTAPIAPPLRGRHAAGQRRAALRPRRRDQPHPLALQRAPRRAAREGVRPRAGRRPVDHARPRSRPCTPASGTTHRSRRRSRSPRRSRCGRSPTTARWP